MTRLKSLLPRSFDVSLALGVAGTVAYYAVILQPRFNGSLLQRYTAANPVDYVIVGLFIWGLIDLAIKAMAFPKELLSQREEWLPQRSGQEPIARATELLATIQARPQWLRESRLGSRIERALQYAKEHGAGTDYREHLKYLAERGEDDTSARYHVVRFVIAVSPMLGFLGTVVHFGTALSGISFDEMDQKLAVVVSEMGEAFNTTTVALGVAMSVMFVMFLAERFDKAIDRYVDRFAERELADRFEARHENLSPFVSTLQVAHEDALRLFTGTLDRQVGLWSSSLEQVFAQFQQSRETDAAAWTDALLRLEQLQEQRGERSEERLIVRLEQAEVRQSEHLAQIQTTLTGIGSLRSEFAALNLNLQSLTAGEGRLRELQESLNRNVSLIEATQKMDEAMHGLTAAIHLLTARHRKSELPDTRAA
jgi:biopolymer transport protein ExbB/TolQ